MMNREECAKCWKIVVKCHNKTRNASPKLTAELVVEELGLEKANEVFATIARIKARDGRIYGANRDWTNQININPDNAVYESGNPVIAAGLDEIHTTHINQIITALRLINLGSAT